MNKIHCLFSTIAILVLTACSNTLPNSVTGAPISAKLDETPRLAILAAYKPEIEALLPKMDIEATYQKNGVTFYIGEMEEIDVVVFLTGISLVNASMNSQLVIDHFNVEGILVNGVAGGVNPELSFGDVTVPAQWGQYNEMVFMRETADGTYAPHPGSGPFFKAYDFMAPRGMRVATKSDPTPAERKFWYPVDPRMLGAAKRAAGKVTFKQCLNDGKCLPRPPKVEIGGNGVTGSVFQDNAKFRAYLFETFSADVLEMETSAIGTVAYANDIPYIGFRSLSDLAGGGGGVNEYPIFEGLASENAAAFLATFLKEYAAESE